jgi:transcriptional regulator with XRE-family HTH domain
MAFTLSFIMASNGNRASAKATNRALGKRLAQLRKMRGYSQRELARRVGAVQVVISDYEHGKLRLSAEMALRFATALDIPVQELLHVSKPSRSSLCTGLAADSCAGWNRSNVCLAASKPPS